MTSIKHPFLPELYNLHVQTDKHIKNTITSTAGNEADEENNEY